ncbi:hypothetical protein P7245_22355 [Vibrio parahaemolyticus]|nr:hypothetical protein [Vibrio parahaemolyticus]
MNVSSMAPAILCVNIAQGLTEKENAELRKLTASTPSDAAKAQQSKERIEELLKKRSAPNDKPGLEGWIVIPLLGSDIIPFLPDSYTSSIVKRVETVGDGVVMSSTMNAANINIKTHSCDLANAIVNVCQILYGLEDSFARIAFFSPEMVVTSGVFLSMTRSVVLGQTEEQIISIQVQQGTPKIDIAKQLLSKQETSTEVIKSNAPVTAS